MMDVVTELKDYEKKALHVAKLPEYDPEKVTLPTRGSVDSAGLDLYAIDDIMIKPQTNEMIHTGIAVEIPRGYVGLVFARSGMAHKLHVRPSNAVGVIDADYRGEVLVSLYNDDISTEVHVTPGQRIAQMVIVPYLSLEIQEVEKLSDTTRGEGGFGSTGN